jgi:hypothetical protein
MPSCTSDPPVAAKLNRVDAALIRKIRARMFAPYWDRRLRAHRMAEGMRPPRPPASSQGDPRHPSR